MNWTKAGSLKADNLKLEHKVSIRTEQLAEEKQKVEKQNHQILQKFAEILKYEKV